MSQYRFINNNGNLVLYGLDKPTGGYFLTELDSGEELILERTGMTFSDLKNSLTNMYNYILENIEIDKLKQDFKNNPDPTYMQKVINEMFGENVDNNLEQVRRDLEQLGE